MSTSPSSASPPDPGPRHASRPHPVRPSALERSRVHRRLLARLPRLDDLTLNDLYEAYPDFDIDIAREQRLLLEHDIIAFQHPFFWYSTPPLLKQWQDLVLEHGWAYGRTGVALRGKRVLHVISAGGREEAYQHDGLARHTIGELLAPLEQTATLCGLVGTPPYDPRHAPHDRRRHRGGGRRL